MQGFGLNGIYPRVAQFEQLKLSLDLLIDKGTIFYVPGGKPDLIKYLSQLGYGFVNRGFWNQLKLEVRDKPFSSAIVQKFIFKKLISRITLFTLFSWTQSNKSLSSD